MIKFITVVCAAVVGAYAVVVAQEIQAGNVRLAKNCEFTPVRVADARGHHWLCR